MNDDYAFDFEQELMDQYAAQFQDDPFDFDDYSVGIEVESYDP